MSRQTKAQRLVRKARQGQEFTKVVVPRTTCPRCRRDVYAEAAGEPRPHLRDTQPGELMFSSIVPTMIDCAD
jgi:hypothetical protein